MIDYSVLAIPKTRPRVLDKLVRQRERDREERECRAKVNARDQHRCFFPRCRTYASDPHHIVPSSIRGKRVWRTDDIASACREHHDWFKAQLIAVSGNPDKGPLKVTLTKLGREAGIRIPAR